MFRKDIIFNIVSVEREYRAATLAIDELLQRSLIDPTLLSLANINHADVRACRKISEITYLVRMFAVFEESLREVRQACFNRSTAIKTYDLLRQCASRQHVADDDLANADRVRQFRNAVVHGGEAETVMLSEARSWLCTFFGWMPPRW